MDSLSQNKQKLWLILFYQFISLSLFCSLVQRFPYEKAWKCFREGTIKRLLAYWIGKVQWRKKSNAKNITLTHIIYIIRTILFSREHSFPFSHQFFCSKAQLQLQLWRYYIWRDYKLQMKVSDDSFALPCNCAKLCLFPSASESTRAIRGRGWREEGRGGREVNHFRQDDNFRLVLCLCLFTHTHQFLVCTRLPFLPFPFSFAMYLRQKIKRLNWEWSY